MTAQSHFVTGTFQPPSAASTRLQGGWLWTARVGWVVVAALTWGLFLASHAANLARLRTVCLTPDCASGQLTPAGVTMLAAQGFSLEQYVWWTVLVTVLVALAYTVSALVIVVRRSDDWLALLAALMLITFSLATFTNAAHGWAEAHPFWRLPTQFIALLGDLLFMLFILLFPSGRFVPRGALLVLALWVVTRTPHHLFPASALDLEYTAPWLYNLAFLAGLFGGVGAQVYRYWRVSNEAERQQTKWVVFGLLTAISGFVLCALFYYRLTDFRGQDVLAALLINSAGLAFMLLIPVTLTIAVLRRRLWEIDPIINRTLVYGALTVTVLGLYVVIVGMLGALFQAQGNFLIAILATGVAAVLFEPLRNRLQRGINRLMYGERDDPYAVLARLGQRLENTLAPAAVLPTVVETVREALKLPYAAIALVRSGSEETVVAAAGEPIATSLILPLVYQGETVGHLALAARAPGEPFSPADRRLLDGLTHQAGVAAHAVRLTLELQQLTQDLQSSRERLVTAREEERRRLRRDLHDGLGPALANLTLQIEAAREFLTRDPVRADKLLADLTLKAQAAITDIRRLVYDLRPPTLDEFGLLFAMREQAAQYEHTGLQTTINAPDPLPPLPAAVEVAVYRIVQEALTNVVRHAQAQSCTVTLTVDDELTLEIRDDGQGLPATHHAGVGLSSMRERAEEVGGSFMLVSVPGQGVRLLVRLPLVVWGEENYGEDSTAAGR